MNPKVKMDIQSFVERFSLKYRIPKVAIKALKDFGVFDAGVLTVLTENEINAIPGVSEKTSQALKDATKELRGPLYQEACDYKKNVTDNYHYLTTGSENINKLLKGGFRTRALTELAGCYRSGKSQICLTSAVTAQLPIDQGGLDSKVIYIDTTNSFTVEHYLAIGERFNIQEKDLLQNLFIVQADQMRFLNQAIERLPGYVQALDAKLIIIDSLIAPFEREYTTLREVIIVQKLLHNLLGFLKRIACGFNSVVLFTNHVEANYNASREYVPFIITGGVAIAHASDVRVHLKKRRENSRQFKIEACSWLPVDDAEFYLTQRGIADTKEYILPKELEVKDNDQLDFGEESPFDIE